MSEAVWVALVTGGLVVLSGTVATVGQVFGQAWQQTRRARADRALAERDAQRQAAVDFLQCIWNEGPGTFDRIAQARVAFIASLPDERVTPEVLQYTLLITRNGNKLDLRAAPDLLLGWLGGRVSDSKLGATVAEARAAGAPR
ncbi:hypothetical protein AKG07_08845 [Microbacterium sp. CGR1]|nr:hypothetical protein AKG07_08845 [Microbacterium sp. CGR1]